MKNFITIDDGGRVREFFITDEELKKLIDQEPEMGYPFEWTLYDVEGAGTITSKEILEMFGEE